MLDHAQQFLTQVHGVMHTPVHAHAAQWVVDVGRVTGQQHTAMAEVFGHALVHLVQRAVHGLVGDSLGQQALQTALHRLVAHDLVVCFFHLGGKQNAPQRGHAQQHTPLFGVGAIVHIAQLGQVVGVFKRGGNHQKTLGISEAFELNVLAFAHRTPGPIGADQIVTLHLVGLAIGAQARGHAIGGLVNAFDLGVEVHRDMGHGVELVFDQLGELPLLALQAIRVVGVTAQQLHVELSDQALLAIALLGIARNQALGNEAIGQTQGGQHVQGGRVEGGRAQIQTQGGGRFGHGHPHACAGQHQSGHQANRAGARNHHMCLTQGKPL